MIIIKSPIKDTSENGVVIQTGWGFPLAYYGKGSYSGDIIINSSHASSHTETALLIYVGMYSSIGTETKIFCDVNHDFRSIYMGAIAEYADTSENASFRDRWGMSTKRMKHRGTIVIGNDVWLGDNVTLVSDVTIGNGAVIGAGSVVAKDVPPYAIYCGNPAVCVGYRFSPETIEGLQKISWWNSNPSELKAMEADMKGEADDLVAKYLPFATDLRNSTAPFEAQRDAITMVAFVDTETPFPTYGDIIANFIEHYSNRSAELILCYYNDSERDLKVVDSLMGIQSSLDGIVNFRLLGITPEDDESVISHADCMILGRDTRNIQRISYAFKYNVKLISGANSPMF